MKHLTPLRPYLILCCLAWLLPPLVASSEERTPNIIFILADDMGVGDVSHHGGLAPTPHIDRLAGEGMRFTDAHSTSSVCTPTRYSILTGRYNWRSPLKKSVLFGLDQPLIPEDRLTVADLLREEGYRTGIVGKWHLGLGWQKLPDGRKREAQVGPTKGGGWDIDYSKQVTGGPLALGFDESFIIPASLDMFPYVYLRDDKATQIPTVTKQWVRAGPAANDFEAVNCLNDFAREARMFIRRQSGRPFFLYLSLTSPHTPIVPSAQWQGKSPLGSYGDFLMETDWVVGEVLEELEEQDIERETIVIFTTDNGTSPAAKIDALEAQGHIPNGRYRGAKADVFEGGHRVPFVLRWPEHVQKNTVCKQTISQVDFFRTVAELTGAEVPENAGEDSFSLLPLLKQPARAAPIRPFTIHHSYDGTFALRQGNWKLICGPGSGGWSDPKPKEVNNDPAWPALQLYNLESDIAETENLWTPDSAIANQLVNLLVKAIRDGRTTPGVPQQNDGYPDTFIDRVKEAYPKLKPSMQESADRASSSSTTHAKAVAFKPDQILPYKTVGETVLNLHIFYPEDHKASDARPAILFFFGGGWTDGSPSQLYPHCDYLASRGMVGIAAEYRVAKRDGTSPIECVKDGKSAIRWVRQNADSLGIDPGQILAGGASAGGHVAAAASILKGYNEAGEDLSISTRPEALVLFNPVIDNGPEGYGYDRVKEYWEDFSPMHNIDSPTPPTVFFLGTKDHYIPVSTAEAYKRRVEAAGGRCEVHTYEGQGHGFFNYYNRELYDKTVAEMDRFLVSLGYLQAKPDNKVSN